MLGAGGLALLALWWSALPVWVCLLLTPCLLASGWRQWHLHVTRRHPRSVLGVRFEEDGLLLHTPTGRFPGRLRADTRVLSGLIMLRADVPGLGVLSLPLLPDSLPAEDWRRLRVLLRTGARHWLPEPPRPWWRRGTQ